MSKTDRQTDKSACWSVTAFGDEINIIEDVTTYPAYVKEILGGREMCPSTNKLHFQGAIILHSQQRLSALKKWLPTAHFEPARSREALKRYAMKDDTAVGDKVIRQNTVPYLKLHDKMMYLAEAMAKFSASDVDKMLQYEEKNPKDGEFWYLVTEKVLPFYGQEIIGAFADPEVRTVWRNTKAFWLAQPARPPLSITEAADSLESSE